MESSGDFCQPQVVESDHDIGGQWHIGVSVDLEPEVRQPQRRYSTAGPGQFCTGFHELYDQGLIEARSVEQTSVFEAAEQFARVEGILPAPESSHAIRVAIDEALKCKETGEEKTILFGLTGTGYFDMVAYEKYNNGEMSDYIPTDKDLEAGFAGLPKQPE